jgi:OPA family glycerol-3-phosphate transporter-like MFS transporter/OPA family sugar phosphate sensor protein UhpC-like MFS transporter
LTLPDTPPSVGLPEVEGTETKVATDDGLRGFKAVLAQKVFGNKYVWIIALANFFVYVVRYAILDWGPTMLSQSKGIKLSHAGWMIATFELCGLAGMLLSGWLTDRVFGGRGARAGMISMAMAGLSILLFWKAAGNSAGLSTVLLGMAGFFIYGPQALTGIIVANLGTKHAAATAVGLTGLFGYASTVLSGWGLGALVEHFGWEAAFRWLALSAAIGCALFAAAWGAPAHGYSEAKAGR